MHNFIIYSLICSVRNNEIGNAQFHMDCTTAVMQLLIDFIKTSIVLFKNDQETLIARIQSLSYKDLASFLKIVDQLCLQEMYLTHLEQLIVPIFKDSKIIKSFLTNKDIQDIVSTCDNLGWKKLFPRTFILASLDKIISTQEYPELGTHLSIISKSAFSLDGKLIATVSYDEGIYTVNITDIATGEILSTISDNNGITSVAFSPDGKLFAIGSSDRTAKIIDIATEKILSTISHNNEITSVAFSPNGEWWINTPNVPQR